MRCSGVNDHPASASGGAEAVIAYLKAQGLHGFVRSKEEVNKEAMLNQLDKARGLPGVTIVTGLEDFSITPFELNTEVST